MFLDGISMHAGGRGGGDEPPNPLESGGPHPRAAHSSMHGSARRFLTAAIISLVCGCSVVRSIARISPPPGVDALADIVGTWQSDTTNGTSALSACAWTPQRAGVVCDQTISTPNGVQHATDLFTFDRGAGRYVFYVLGRPGDAMSPVALAIDRHVWTYGGRERNANGVYTRTVNDFTQSGAYTWRVESSSDGVHWTEGLHGRSRRVSAP